MLFKDILLRYSRQTVTVIGSMVLCGIAEGLGIVALLPFIGILTNSDQENPHFIAIKIKELFNFIGLDVTILSLLILITIMMVLKSVFIMLAKIKAGYAGIKVATDLRIKLIRSLMKARYGLFIKNPIGLFSNALTLETKNVTRCYHNSCSVFSNIIQSIFYIVLASAISPQVTIAALIVGIVIILALGWLIGIARRLGQKETSLYKGLTIRFIDGLNCIKTLKSMGRENSLEPILRKEIDKLNETQKTYVLTQHGLLALQEPILVIALSCGMFIGITVLKTEFEALMVLALLFWRTLAMIARSQSLYQNISRTESYYWSIWDTINNAEKNEEQHKGNKEPHFNKKITVDNLTFQYEDTVIFDKINLTIQKGEYIGITGPSGSGKTTFVDLTIGLLYPHSGSIKIDNIPLNEIDIKKWRSKIGYVQQESILFYDTISINVSLGDSSITEEQVINSLKASGAWEFVSSLPDNIHTILTEKGSSLSGGQRQRIAIARALVRNPELLILDEATTSLDPETEKAVSKTIEKLKGRVTIISISHQQAMIDIADTVYALAKDQNIQEIKNCK